MPVSVRRWLPRVTILDRYILREFVVGALAVIVALLVIFTGSTFADVIDKVASGRMAAGVMFTVLGLHLVSTLQTTLPLGMFLGMLLALGRMYRDNEMPVLAASGFGPRGLLKPAAVLGIATMLLVAAVSLWLGPLAVRTSHREVAKANRSVIAIGLAPGEFASLAGGGVLLAGRVSRDGSHLGDVFAESEHTGKNGVVHIDVVTAQKGKLATAGRGDARFIALRNGHRYDIRLGRDDWRELRFQRSDVALTPPPPDDGDRPDNQRTTLSLLGDRDAAARAELQWRIALPLDALVLAMLALPLGRQRPRSSPAGRMLIGVLAYLIVMNLMVVTRMYIGGGRLAASFGMWWILLPVFAGAAWTFARQHAVHGVRAKRA
ncbi:MAG TPA: LPS export ABC transporter permease LptF [Rhodanobacteraceae bacterium]